MRVYIAGPISKGPLHANVRQAIVAADTIFREGHAPFVPHLDFLWELVSPCTYESRLTYDFEWIRVCNALIRLPGESPGSDREVAYARSLNIPVFFSAEEFLNEVNLERM